MNAPTVWAWFKGPWPKPGRLLPQLFGTAGAYGANMASEYNGRPLVPEVMAKGDKFAVIRPRPSYDQMIGAQKLPEWMG